MSDEPNSLNGHGPGRDNAPLSPDLEALARRLSADGAMWQQRLPDPSGVAARIRAIPLLAPGGDDDEGDFPMSIQSPPIYGPPTTGGRPPRLGPQRGILAALAAVVVVALIAGVLIALAGRGTATGPISQPTATTSLPTATLPAPTATPTTYPVQVYFSRNPDSYSDDGAVFGVERIAPQANDAAYAIEQLIAGPTADETAQGYFTELTAALSGTSTCGGADITITLNMKGSTAQTGTATLQFCRATHLPGDMSGPRIKAEITKTLTQFTGITSVVILGQDGHCFDDSAGADMCLQ